MEWKLSELSVDGKGHYGIGAPAIPYDKNKPTYLRITDINDDGTINFLDLKSVDDEDSNKYLLKENDIVFARTGNSTGRSYFYQKEHGDFVYAGFLIKFSIDPQKVNPKILKYYTHSQEYYNWVKSFDTGGTRGNINAKTFGDMPISLPKRCVQDKIVGILSALDSKIENNNKINANLEAQAEALFKSWFVDFTPFKDQPFVDSELGPIPQGWKVGKLGDYCEVKSGYAFKSSWWTNKGYKIIKIKNISENGDINLNDCSCVLPENCDKAKNFIANTGDIVIAMTGATIGKFNIIPKIDEKFYINQRVGKFFLGEKPIEKVPYIYCFLKQENISTQIIQKGQGSAQPNISGADIESIPMLTPMSIILKYNKMCQPLFEKILSNRLESKKLSALRDTLLPKLMSGEIKL